MFSMLSKMRPLARHVHGGGGGSVDSARSYSNGCCGCPPPMDCGSQKIQEPCYEERPQVPPNPCQPHHDMGGKGGYKKYKYLTFFVMFPLIGIQMVRAFSHEEIAQPDCRDFEYMRIRTHRFPWGDGVKTLFHNPHVNKLPGECSRPPAQEQECTPAS